MSQATFTHPRLGCGAAILRDGKILLLRRARPPEVGHWSLPGGKVDLWEPVETAVRREVIEELGIVLGPLRLLCVVDHMADGQHWVAPTYLATDFEGEPENREPEKHTGRTGSRSTRSPPLWRKWSRPRRRPSPGSSGRRGSPDRGRPRATRKPRP